MKNIKDIVFGMFKDRTVGFWLSFGAGVLSVVFAIAYVATDFGDVTFSTVAFVLVLVAGLFQIVALAFDISPLLIIPVALISTALGLHIYTAAPSITDVFNGINLYGGNGELGIAFIVMFLVAAIVCAVACFMKQRKAPAAK